MGIYIPNMKKPINCKVCPFTCEKLAFFDGKNRPQGCPIIEIDDIQYKASLEFSEKLMKRLEEHILYGERRSDELNTERD